MTMTDVQARTWSWHLPIKHTSVTDLGYPKRDLPRKEVIQPHLPVQLPCYDFVPVTNPALGRYLPCGLAHGLQALSASMT